MNPTLLGVLALVGYVLAKPATFDEYLSIEDDIATVGSMRRDVRAPAPTGFATEVEDLLIAGTELRKSREAKENQEPKKTAMKNESGQSKEGGYYKTFGSDAEGEKGYLKQSYSKGDKGYKTLDTFHKQNGDNYGFEKHTAFGKANGAETSGEHGHSAAQSSHDHGSEEPEGAGTIVDTHYVPVDGGSSGYSQSEHFTEGGDASDGDGGHFTEGGDSGHYSDGGDSGHYSDGGESGHYTSGGEGTSGSYSHGGGGSEHYSTGSDSGDAHGYDSGYVGDHY